MQACQCSGNARGAQLYGTSHAACWQPELQWHYLCKKDFAVLLLAQSLCGCTGRFVDVADGVNSCLSLALKSRC